MKNLNQRFRQKGFTLIEVFVSMALFVIGLLSIFSLQLNALSSLSDAKIKKQAMFYASSYHEIQTLSQITKNDISPLNKKWLSNIQQNIPDIKISYELNSYSAKESLVPKNPSALNKHIKLIWPSSQKVAHCQSTSKEYSDCLRL